MTDKKFLGSKDNPFENIDELFDYISNVENSIVDSNLSYQSYKFLFNNEWEKGKSKINQKYAEFLNENIPSHSFIVTRQQSGKYVFKPNLTKRSFLYRGQNFDYEKCVPSLYRNKNYYLDELILNHEMWVLIESHPLVQLLGIQGIQIKNYDFLMATNYPGIYQHYANKTNFLDLTSDVDVAKFFACTDCKDNKYMPHIEEGLGVIYCYKFDFNNSFQQYWKSPNEFFHLSNIGKQVFPRSGAQSGFLLQMGKDMDLNCFPNVKKLYFKHNEKIANRIFSDSKKGTKYMPPSILDEYWEQKLSSTKREKVISHEALEINLKYNPKETNSSLQNKLRKMGFKIGKHAPHFNEEQLKSYYQDIKNGWWEDVFCDDIYFGLDKDGKLKNELKSIRKNPEYAYAFNLNAPKFNYKFDLIRF